MFNLNFEKSLNKNEEHKKRKMVKENTSLTKIRKIEKGTENKNKRINFLLRLSNPYCVARYANVIIQAFLSCGSTLFNRV